MAQVDREREALYSRLRSIESDLSSALAAISEVESKFARIDGATASLPSRLTSVRGRGYAAMGHLEKSIELFTKKWMEVSPTIKQNFYSNVQPLTGQIRALQAEVQRLKAGASFGGATFGWASVGRLSAEASTLRARVAAETAKINTSIGEFLGSIDAIDRDLKIAEKTMELFSFACFPLKPEESPVLAIEGKIMTKDKCDGTLYFTNQRFIFEGKKEVVLEKKLFIATKKKTERTVLIEQPIGALQEISKGRVGLIAWTGVYIRFKPERGLEETPFDVKDWEADVITRFFQYIIGGEADRDIATIRGITPKEAPTIQVVRCPHCGAPYTKEIYKGQTSVQCEYCGTSIVIK
jgi:DNA-directed RNA polymerase subunit RPC12/RpoP/prefoldin subunit 5